jgi:NAD-dependent DNA ligase
LGQEVICTVRHQGKSLKGKALLESSEVLLCGDTPLKIPFASIAALNVVDGELRVHTKDGLTVFVLGDKAAKWRDRIANPKTLVEKLGPKAGDEVVLIGKFETEFVAQLKQAGAKTSSKVSPSMKWLLLGVDTQADLSKVKTCARAMQDSTALWIAYRKGQKTLSENDVRSAGLKAGLTDIKVTKFSETHTALKFVIPKAKRK